ncbi:hypothetical protein [Pseudomonas kribbensis]|uniref:Uncharacterized protein n=1 Tax=Pseudomonas kribbensis TaxID=1628086 RepID=A0A4Y8VN68_9PSED|nr:hypothetical protein [Pseudomonas kribbensis]TFH81808.1 hypothetical protein E4J90_09530 [Pseudomonas kribbensis]
MKLRTTPTVATNDPVLQRELREHAVQVNLISEGRIAGFYTALTAAPTSGDWIQGDEVRNSTPSELGTAGSKYFIDGWKCVASGTPGTWVQKRCLTGN